MTALRRGLALGIALVATAALVALSNVAATVEPSSEALLRLSWRAVGELVEECRALSEEEQAALPLHMRRSEICEGRLAPFDLDVRLDGEPVLRSRVLPAGARGDRPAYVLEELVLAPGPHELAVTFGVAAGGEAAPVAAPLELRTAIYPGPREVVLVTRDEESGALIVRSR